MQSYIISAGIRTVRSLLSHHTIMKEFLIFFIAFYAVNADQYGGGGYGGGGYPEKQRHIKLNFGIHVPPIVLKMPKVQMPQLTIKANFLKKPHAKPLEVNIPPPPQISFGEPEDSYGGGGYGGGGYGGGGGGYGGGAPGYGGGDSHGAKSEVNFHKTIKVSQDEGYGGQSDYNGGNHGHGGYAPPPEHHYGGHHSAYSSRGGYQAPPSPDAYSNSGSHYAPPPPSGYGPPPHHYGNPSRTGLARPDSTQNGSNDYAVGPVGPEQSNYAAQAPMGYVDPSAYDVPLYQGQHQNNYGLNY